MKKVLITGANSYVGSNVENWLKREPNKYYVKTLDMKDPNWKAFNFSMFDVVFHVAGIAHVKETKNNKDLFFSINRDLAAETARISKNANVRHFIFLSTMSVYGDYIQEISDKTSVNPTSSYGLSKVEAEKMINELGDEYFKVTIIRPPMIYGPNCKGNYSKLRKIAKKVPVFPDINNRRTFLFVDNFSIYVEKIIRFEQSGIKHPHNKKNVSTTDLIRAIAESNDKKIIFSKILYKILCLFPLKKIKKLIKNQYYSFSNDSIDNYSFEQSIIITEENWNEVKN